MATPESPRIAIPRSAVAGVGWPAIPGNKDAAVLALRYQLEQTQWWSAAALRQAQLRQAESLLRHALATVPLYRQKLAALADLPPGRLDDRIWRRLPILTRPMVQQAGAALYSEKPPEAHGKVGEIRTSGSTGRPVTVRVTPMVGLFFSANSLRYHDWHRRDLRATVACIRNLNARQFEASQQGRGMGWAPAYATGPMMFFPINRPVSEQLDWLLELDPPYLLTFPSNLQALLKLSRQQGRRPGRLQQVVTMSETLDPAVRLLCRAVWGAPLVDSYSSEEAGLIAVQCPDNEAVYHLQSESLLAEILDAEGRPCAPGAIGRVVVTPLHNFAMPLLRYEIGDYAEAGAPCSCGRGLPTVNRILGRARNMLVLPSGDRLWPSLPENRIMPLAPIRQFQLVQHSLEDVEVRLAVARPLSAGEEAALRDTLTDCLRHPFPLRFTYLDEIPRAANGKYEDFVSTVTAADGG